MKLLKLNSVLRSFSFLFLWCALGIPAFHAYADDKDSDGNFLSSGFREGREELQEAIYEALREFDQGIEFGDYLKFEIEAEAKRHFLGFEEEKRLVAEQLRAWREENPELARDRENVEQKKDEIKRQVKDWIFVRYEVRLIPKASINIREVLDLLGSDLALNHFGAGVQLERKIEFTYRRRIMGYEELDAIHGLLFDKATVDPREPIPGFGIPSPRSYVTALVTMFKMIRNERSTQLPLRVGDQFIVSRQSRLSTSAGFTADLGAGFLDYVRGSWGGNYTLSNGGYVIATRPHTQDKDVVGKHKIRWNPNKDSLNPLKRWGNYRVTWSKYSDQKHVVQLASPSIRGFGFGGRIKGKASRVSRTLFKAGTEWPQSKVIAADYSIRLDSKANTGDTLQLRKFQEMLSLAFAGNFVRFDRSSRKESQSGISHSVAGSGVEQAGVFQLDRVLEKESSRTKKFFELWHVYEHDSSVAVATGTHYDIRGKTTTRRTSFRNKLDRLSIEKRYACSGLRSYGTDLTDPFPKTEFSCSFRHWERTPRASVWENIYRWTTSLMVSDSSRPGALELMKEKSKQLVAFFDGKGKGDELAADLSFEIQDFNLMTFAERFGTPEAADSFLKERQDLAQSVGVVVDEGDEENSGILKGTAKILGGAFSGAWRGIRNFLGDGSVSIERVRKAAQEAGEKAYQQYREMNQVFVLDVDRKNTRYGKFRNGSQKTEEFSDLRELFSEANQFRLDEVNQLIEFLSTGRRELVAPLKEQENESIEQALVREQYNAERARLRRRGSLDEQREALKDLEGVKSETGTLRNIVARFGNTPYLLKVKDYIFQRIQDAQESILEIESNTFIRTEDRDEMIRVQNELIQKLSSFNQEVDRMIMKRSQSEYRVAQALMYSARHRGLHAVEDPAEFMESLEDSVESEIRSLVRESESDALKSFEKLRNAYLAAWIEKETQEISDALNNHILLLEHRKEIEGQGNRWGDYTELSFSSSLVPESSLRPSQAKKGLFLPGDLAQKKVKTVAQLENYFRPNFQMKRLRNQQVQQIVFEGMKEICSLVQGQPELGFFARLIGSDKEAASGRITIDIARRGSYLPKEPVPLRQWDCDFKQMQSYAVSDRQVRWVHFWIKKPSRELHGAQYELYQDLHSDVMSIYYGIRQDLNELLNQWQFENYRLVNKRAMKKVKLYVELASDLMANVDYLRDLREEQTMRQQFAQYRASGFSSSVDPEVKKSFENSMRTWAVNFYRTRYEDWMEDFVRAIYRGSKVRTVFDIVAEFMNSSFDLDPLLALELHTRGSEFRSHIRLKTGRETFEFDGKYFGGDQIEFSSVSSEVDPDGWFEEEKSSSK